MSLTENDLYRERAPLWWFWILTYAGGEYMRGSAMYSLAGQAVQRLNPLGVSAGDLNYLWKFEGEDAKNYGRRVERAHFDRVAGQALDAIVAGVRQDVQMPTVPEVMKAFLEDVDARGSKWTEWAQTKATIVGMQGHCHVGSDLPDDAMVESGRRAAGLPFQYLIPPLSLIGWELDEWGEWTKCIVREAVPVRAGDVRDVSGQSLRLRYRVWTRDTISYLDGQGKALPFVDADGTPISNEIENPFGLIPITTTYYAPDPLLAAERMGRSWMEVPARKNQEHYNLGSMILEIAFKVTFPVLAVPVADGETSVAPEQKVAFGLGQAMAYQQGGGVPTWLNPPRDSIDVLRELRRENVQAIRAAAGLGSQDMAGGESKEMPSGEALRERRVQLGALLGTFGRQLSAGDTRDLQMAAEIAGYDKTVVAAPYPDDYAAPDSLVRLDEVAKALADIGLGTIPTPNAMLMEAALRVVLPAGDADQMTLAVEEIKAAAVKKAEALERQEKAKEEAVKRLGQVPPGEVSEGEDVPDVEDADAPPGKGKPFGKESEAA